MRDMPSRVRLDPDYNGHQRQVVGWASDVPVDDEHGWTEYVRADLSDALLREAMEALEEIAVRDSLPTPSFGGVKLGQYAYINRAGPLAEIAHATLAKLRAHLEGEKE